MKDEVKPIINDAPLASIDYVVPGSVIAVGILICICQLDDTLDAWMHSELRDRDQARIIPFYQNKAVGAHRRAPLLTNG